MKVRSKVVLVVGVAGLSLAACGGTKVAGSSTSSTPAKNATVGFNATKTEFVLPHNLGYLPAPELALAKADPAYASGLANTGDWMQIRAQVSQLEEGFAHEVVMLWGYVGAPSTGSPQVAVTDTKATAMLWNGVMATIDGRGAIKVLNSAPVALSASTLNTLFTASSQLNSNAVAKGDRLIAPSMLEVQAAPVGTMTAGGTSVPAFCVPVPEAFVNSGGKVIVPSSFPVMTAGPSTVFGGVGMPTGGASPIGIMLYDQGVVSCANFH